MQRGILQCGNRQTSTPEAIHRDRRSRDLLPQGLRRRGTKGGRRRYGCVNAWSRARLTTARFALETGAAVLAYGYLPANATGVVAVLNDGRRIDDEIVSKGAPRVWALSFPAGVNPFGLPPVFYVAADGTETPAPNV